MKKLAVLLCLIPAIGTAALRTSAQDGRWGDTSTWQGGNIPGIGDTASIYHVVTTSGQFTVGTSPAEGNVVINLFSTGTIKVMSGSTLTVRGDVTYTAGTGNTNDAVNVTAGGTFQFDASQASSPSSQNYAFYPDGNFGWRQFTAIGVSSAPAIVKTHASGGMGALKANGTAYSGGYTFSHAVLQYLSFNMYYRDDNGSADPTQWVVTNSTFTGCGQIVNSGGLHPDATFRHDNNTHINTSGGLVFDFRIGYSKSTTGVRSISNNVFDSNLGDNLSLRDFTLSGNFFNDEFQGLYSTATYKNNFFRLKSDNMSIGGQITTSYFLLDADQDNPHVLNTLGKISAWDGVIFGHSGIASNTDHSGDSGEWILPGAEASVTTYTVTRSIFLPNATGYSSAEIFSMLGSAGDPNSWTNYFIDLRHNTWFGGWGSGFPFAAMQISETANMAPGRLSVYKSNLLFNPQIASKRGVFTKYFDVGNYTSNQTSGYGTGPTSNICAPTACDYNGSYGLSFSSYTAANTSTYNNQGKGYIGNFTSTPGANDVDGTNPNFVDYTRNAERFDSDFYRPYMGLPTATLWFSTNTYAIGDVVRHSSSTYYAGATINFRYVNNSGCSSSNPEPGVQGLSSWSNCWEFATYQAIKDAIASNQTFTDATIGASSADVIETLVRWVQYGYRPQAGAYATAAHDGGTIGAMPALPSGGQPSISPSTATVQTTKTIQFTSTNTVTWSMVPGSVGSIDSNGLYTAPSTIQNRSVFLGVPIVPDDHISNTEITSAPVHANSATRIANIGSVPLRFEPFFPPNRLTSTNSTASSMTFRYTTLSNGDTYWFLPEPYRGVETNLRPNNYFDQDRHIMAVNSETCEIQEVYNFYPTGTNTAECLSCNAQSGVKYGPMSYSLPSYDGSTDAAGLQVLPNLIKYEELKRGEINHALRFTLPNSYHLQSYLWPGTNNSTAASCFNSANCFEYGSRIRLKSSFSEAGFSTEARAIIRALKKYGAYDADGGQVFRVQTMSNVLQDTATFNALMVEIPASSLDFTDFEQVDESSLMISSASARVKYPNAYGILGPNYAIVIASNTVDGSATYRHIAVQGVNVGMANTPWTANSGTLSVMAGMPQFQIEYWVTGSTNTSATCSMTPTIGTLTSGCLYTPPSSVVKFSSAVVTITAVADSTAPITFPLVIYSSSGIRVDTGWQATAQVSSPVIPYDSNGNYGPDTNGNYWAGQMPGSVFPWYARDDGSSPQASWRQPQPSDIGLNYSGQHGVSDGGFGALIPNGDYTLTLRFGSDDTNLSSNSVMQIESQNEILMSSSSFVTFIGTSAYTAKTSTHSITVTDNNFYFALRYPDNNSKFTQLSAFELSLDSPAEPPVQSGTPRYIRGRTQFRGRGIIR